VSSESTCIAEFEQLGHGPFLGGSTDTNLASVTENRNGWASRADLLGCAVTVGTVVGFGA